MPILSFSNLNGQLVSQSSVIDSHTSELTAQSNVVSCLSNLIASQIINVMTSANNNIIPKPILNNTYDMTTYPLFNGSSAYYPLSNLFTDVTGTEVTYSVKCTYPTMGVNLAFNVINASSSNNALLQMTYHNDYQTPVAPLLVIGARNAVSPATSINYLIVHYYGAGL